MKEYGLLFSHLCYSNNIKHLKPSGFLTLLLQAHVVYLGLGFFFPAFFMVFKAIHLLGGGEENTYMGTFELSKPDT